MESNILNKEFSQNCGDSLRVLEKTNLKPNKSTDYLYLIEFLNYPCKILARKGDIIRGIVRNPMKPSFYNIGYIGIGNYGASSNLKLYHIWDNILKRCYNEKNVQYKNYGEKGVVVCEEWHNFQNFAKWYIENEVWNKETNYKLSIDKDILCYISNINKIYSPETCILIPEELNEFLMGDKLSTGVLKVSNGKFISGLQTNDVRIHFGTFNTFEEAKLIYSKEKYKCWISLLEKYNLPIELKDILLKYDFYKTKLNKN